MITLHTYSGLDIVRGVTVYRSILECDGYELGHAEYYKDLKTEDIITRIMRYALVTSANFTQFYKYNLTPGMTYKTYKVNDTTISEFLKDKKTLQIKSRLKALEGDFKDA